MNKEEFEVLVYLEQVNRSVTKEEIAENTGINSEEISEICKKISVNGFIANEKITQAGKKALEPYRVKRAIFMAAGFGSRLVPITINTPKPLVRVNGQRMIETVLDAVVEAGIDEIIIIRGYLAEQFDQLIYKYPNIKFVENTMYNQANNISSVMCVNNLLKNSYIIEADLILSNHKLIKKYQYHSNTLGMKVDSSNDWCFVVKNGIITKLIPNGNEYKQHLKPDEELYQEFGISYLSEEDGAKLENHIKAVFDTQEGKSRFWEQVQFGDYADQYQVHVRPCEKSDIVEIDSYKELVAIDKSYII